MMEIELQDVSRSFAGQEIFRKVNFTFKEGNRYALLGGNGSGKSTLLKIVYGALSPSAGKVLYRAKQRTVRPEDAPFSISLASPYFELIEELTATEFLDFYRKFKPFIKGYTSSRVLETAYLSGSAQKEIRHFSSGMTQRLRLALAVFSDVSFILLDEPASNLDPEGIQWYKNLISAHTYDRAILVGSNFNEDETVFCGERLELKHYK